MISTAKKAKKKDRRILQERKEFILNLVIKTQVNFQKNIF